MSIDDVEGQVIQMEEGFKKIEIDDLGKEVAEHFPVGMGIVETELVFNPIGGKIIASTEKIGANLRVGAHNNEMALLWNADSATKPNSLETGRIQGCGWYSDNGEKVLVTVSESLRMPGMRSEKRFSLLVPEAQVG